MQHQQPSLTTGASTRSALENQDHPANPGKTPSQDPDERVHEVNEQDKKPDALKDVDDFVHRRNQTVITKRPFNRDVDDIIHPPAISDDDNDR